MLASHVDQGGNRFWYPTRFVSGFGAVLLLASGAYVAYYWLTAGRLLLI
jgi:hypothetical protein